MSSNLKLFDDVNFLLQGLSLCDGTNTGCQERVEDSIVKVEQKNVAKSCNYCRVNFESVLEQRAHYKLDWHRYNLKRALMNRSPISAEEFEQIAKDDDVSSISGSESDSSDAEDNESDLINFELRNAKIFWKTSTGQIYSIFKCLLFARRDLLPTDNAIQDHLTNFLTAPKQWLILMLGGGHFAAAIFRGSSVIVHKTFHCYTVRAKQGGGQSARDSRGNHPKSAGASLRRYNEAALIQHVQDIVSAWAEEISKCSLILYPAVGVHNKSVIFGGKTAPFSKLDHRLRPIPFTTRRATFKEVKRVHDVLSTIVCHGTFEEFRKEDFSVNQSSQKKGPKNVDRGKERDPVQREIPGGRYSSSSESEGNHDLFLQDTEMDLKGLKEFDSSFKRRRRKTNAKVERNKFAEQVEKLHAKLITLCKNGESSELKDLISTAEGWPCRGGAKDISGECILKREDFYECLEAPVSPESLDTLLHIAASNCRADVVSVLLRNGCDPTVRNKRKLVPYVVSGDKATKNAFKDFVAEFPDRFDSKHSMIPPPRPPLTEEEERLQNEKKKEKRKQQREREKAKKQEIYERKVSEDERIRFLSLSDREKRALAAEKRIIHSITANSSKAAVPVLVRCFLCGRDITGKVPFEYNNMLFCTITCLKDHRAKSNSGAKKSN